MTHFSKTRGRTGLIEIGVKLSGFLRLCHLLYRSDESCSPLSRYKIVS